MFAQLAHRENILQATAPKRNVLMSLMKSLEFPDFRPEGGMSQLKCLHASRACRTCCRRTRESDHRNHDTSPCPIRAGR